MERISDHIAVDWRLQVHDAVEGAPAALSDLAQRGRLHPQDLDAFVGRVAQPVLQRAEQALHAVRISPDIPPPPPGAQERFGQVRREHAVSDEVRQARLACLHAAANLSGGMHVLSMAGSKLQQSLPDLYRLVFDTLVVLSMYANALTNMLHHDLR